MIEHIYLSDTDEKYAPPEQPILEVGLVGDTVYLTTGRYEETFEERKFTQIEGAGISVPVADLVNAIKALAVSQHRHDLVRDLGTDRDLRPVNL